VDIGNDYIGSCECYHTIMRMNGYEVSYADCGIYLLPSYEMFEDNKGVISSLKSKNRQYKGQKKKDKKTKQNTTQKTID